MGCLVFRLKQESFCLGTEVCLEGIKKKQVKLVIVAGDASEKTIKQITFACEKYNVPLLIFGSIVENSHAIGKENRAIIGIKDFGIANKIQELINGGEA